MDHRLRRARDLSPAAVFAVGSFLPLVGLPAVAHADVIWPAAVLEGSILTWWSIGVGLLAEWPAVRFLTATTWMKSLFLVCLANLASTLAGIVLIPLLGFAWFAGPGGLIYTVVPHGGFGPFSWAVTVAIAGLTNVAIEWAMLRVAAKLKLTWRAIGVLFAANLVSIGLALASVFVSPPEDLDPLRGPVEHRRHRDPAPPTLSSPIDPPLAGAVGNVAGE